MFKKVVFVEKIQLSDEDYGLVENWSDLEGTTELGDDFVCTREGMKGLWVTDMPVDDSVSDLIFIYIPELSYGSYMKSSYVKEVE